MKTYYNEEINEDLSYIEQSLRIFAFPCEKLKKDDTNARVHDRNNIEVIKGSLTNFGQQTPIVMTQDFVVKKGNGTLQAAMQLGWKYIAVIKTNLDMTKVKAWAIADNRSGDLSKFDNQVLQKTLKELEDEFSDDLFSFTGFDSADLKELFQSSTKIEKSVSKTVELEKMQLQPLEHYDYVIILAKNTMDWNYLVEFFDLKRVEASVIEKGSKIGLGRGLDASKFIQKINELKAKAGEQ